MDYFVGLTALAVLCLVVFAALGRHRGKTIPVEAKPLLSTHERKAQIALEAALPQHRIYPQVAMGALVRTKASLSKDVRARTRNGFSQKIVDFVAEDRHTNELLLIEVDDRTHNTEKDRRRDAITAAAGYRTIRIPAGMSLTAANIRGLGFPSEQQATEQDRASPALVQIAPNRRRRHA